MLVLVVIEFVGKIIYLGFMFELLNGIIMLGLVEVMIFEWVGNLVDVYYGEMCLSCSCVIQ